MNYRHLTLEERYQIEAGIALGLKVCQIAEKLKRHRSTIFRELKRNGHITQEGYLGYTAHQQYHWRRENCGVTPLIHGHLKNWIDARLNLKWSPEQIAGRRKLEGLPAIGVETIYRYVYEDRIMGGTLWKHLRHTRARRKKRFPHARWPKKVPRPAADERPAVIQERSRLGDFERDLIVGSQWSGYVMTIVDRKSRLVRLEKPSSLRSKDVHDATVRALKRLQVESLTNDNGVEFVSYMQTAKTLGVPVYFTRPYASWERGTVENTNKLIRQFFPKNMSFKEITSAQIKMVQDSLNQRPRKTLGFRTPNEVHFEKRL